MEAMGLLDVLISMQANWRFHHESWAKPWSSDDFLAGESKNQIKQRLCRLISEPWWENTRNEVVQVLHDELPNRWPWGFHYIPHRLHARIQSGCFSGSNL